MWFTDERCVVVLTHPDSNFGMVDAASFSRSTGTPEIHRS